MLKDTDPMPFGRYKGEQMIDVPALHLMALYEGELLQEEIESHGKVKAYIIDNLQVLNMEIRQEQEEIYRRTKRN